MNETISQTLASVAASLKAAENAKHLDGTVYYLGLAQTELLTAILRELGRLNDNLERSREV